MERTGHIEIRIIGQEGNNPLSPDNYDIRDIKSMLENIENMLYPNNKKGRPNITYQIKEGSVRNVFKASWQAVASLTLVLQTINSTNSIDGLELETARTFENLQKEARDSGHIIEFSSSEADNILLKITPETKFERTADLWVDAEFYFYGELTNAGGKDKANIHLSTKEVGTLIITTNKTFLKDEPENLLYRQYGVRVIGKQNIETGEFDKSKLELVQLIDYHPKYDESYLNELIAQASPKFQGIDVDKWLSNLRGGIYE